MHEDLTRDFFLGFIKLHILHHAREEPIYGKEFSRELERHGYRISFGTLYPLFHRLRREGYLKVEEKNVNGRIRKYYSVTGKGERALRDSMGKIKELFDEVYG